MTHITNAELEDFRATLEDERATLDAELAEHGKKSGDDWQGMNETSGMEPDPTDAADEIEELITNVPLVEELESRRKDVTDALRRIKDHTFGICEAGGDEIPLDRLEANPAARTCIAHAE